MRAVTETVGALTSSPRVSFTAPSLNPLVPGAPPPPSNGKHMVHWFRKGMRLHDNPALKEGLREATTFRCVFLIDPWFASSSNIGINKWRFLLQCLQDLDTSLKKLNSRLFVVRGQPADALPKLFKLWGTTLLTFEEDPEPFARVRDHNIISKCRDTGINVICSVSHTLYKLDDIIQRNGGMAPLTYHQFQALIASMPPPPPPLTTIDAYFLEGITTPLSEDHEKKYGVPTLEDLGFDADGLKPSVWNGGETEALTRMARHLERKAWVASFGRPRMTLQSLLASPTCLSPYFRFGCLSTRLFYYQLTELYRRVKRMHPPLSLHGQILWREFFYCAATRNPNFDRMIGNPICVQIPWEKNPEALAKWANGQTGYPWIDAIMIQLREEGWIHHQARHAVACFLTRGDLWISWEEGMKVFNELMLDVDWSVNAGTWMWMSCSSFFQQFFHSYCPVGFGRKIDPNGDFIRKFLPVLKNLPTRFVHEPWLAPEHVQRSARCIIGRDYPLPIVDHGTASEINIERIKQVYAQLAKYSQIPYYTFIPYMQRPQSVIQSIHQSDYLCNQVSEVSQANFKTPIPISGVTGRQPEDIEPNEIPIDPKSRPVVDHPAPPPTMMTQIYSGGFNEPIQYQEESPISQKQYQYDFQNLHINNDLSQNIIEPPQIDNTPRDVFVQPMYYVPYDNAMLGLQPMYTPIVEPQPQHTMFPTQMNTIQPANNLYGYMPTIPTVPTMPTIPAMPTTYTQQEITTVALQEPTYLPMYPTVPTDLNCQILQQSNAYRN